MTARPSGRTPVGVLISGRGSNLGALIEAARAPDFPARIAVVVSNRSDAPGMERARAAGVPAVVVPGSAFGRDRASHEAAIDAVLTVHGCEFVCLAGYMRVLTPFLIDRWAGRMLNIHPSLLPAFPGVGTHRRALDAGVAIHGCTVHLVTEIVDQGPILAQAAIRVLAGDTETDLAARVLAAEHALYPATLASLLGAPDLPAQGSGLLLALRGRPAPDDAPVSGQ